MAGHTEIILAPYCHLDKAGAVGAVAACAKHCAVSEDVNVWLPDWMVGRAMLEALVTAGAEI